MDCLFCKIVAGELPSATVYEDERVRVIRDIEPVAPVHLLVLTKQHIQSAACLAEEHAALMTHIWTAVIPALREHFPDGFRVVTNAGEDSGQSVPHLHFHVLGGKPLGPVG